MTAPVVLITGALTGIGRATALAFARQGARLVISGRRDEKGLALAAELRALGAEAEYVRADVRLEGQTVLSGLDLFRWGGLRQALRFGFVAEVSDGTLDIEVARSTTTSGEARIDAFEVLALPAGDEVFEDGLES